MASEIKFPPYFKAVTETKARYIGIKGGRGSAKTWSVGGWLVLRMAKNPAEMPVCIREVQRTIADSSKALIENRIRAYGFSGLFEPQDTRIKRQGGSDCIFRGMQNHTSDSIKSLEGRTIAWCDEAHKLTERSLELLTPTIRTPGSQLVFTWNPENEDDPVDRFFLDNEGDPDFLLLHVNWDANPWFPEELQKDMARDYQREPDRAAHIWGGEYRSHTEARVFRKWRVGELEPREDVIWFYGADWGFANDPTAALRCCFPDKETIYIDHEASEIGVPTEATPAFINKLPDATKWPMRADSARPEMIDHVKRHGFPRLRKARKGQGSVEDGITFLQGFDIVVHPRCANLVQELKNYAYRTDPRTDETLPVVEDKNNHLIDALRYAVEGLHKRGRVIPNILEEKTEVLKRPPDYQSRRSPADSWKVA